MIWNDVDESSGFILTRNRPQMALNNPDRTSEKLIIQVMVRYGKQNPASKWKKFIAVETQMAPGWTFEDQGDGRNERNMWEDNRVMSYLPAGSESEQIIFFVIFLSFSCHCCVSFFCHFVIFLSFEFVIFSSFFCHLGLSFSRHLGLSFSVTCCFVSK